MAEQEQFTKGQTVYSGSGQSAQYIGFLAGAHIVTPEFENGDGDSYFDGVCEWSRCYAEAPVAKLSSDIAALNKKKDAAEVEANLARTELNALKLERATLDRAGAERMARLKQFAALELLDQFLSGAISHYVIVSEYSVFVKKLDDALSGDDEQTRYKSIPLKLLSLYGDSKGDLAWRLEKYSTGGNFSSTYECFPCVGIEQATELARAKMSEKISGWSAINAWLLDRLIPPATELGIEVPQAMIEKITDYNWSSALTGVEKAQRDLDFANAKLQSLPVPAAPAQA